MNNKNEKMKANELTEQTKNQNAELTDDELDNVTGGSGHSFKRALAESWNTSRKKVSHFLNDD